MSLQLGKVQLGKYEHSGGQRVGAKPQFGAQAIKPQGTLLSKLDSINGELTPKHVGGDIGNKLDYMC